MSSFPSSFRSLVGFVVITIMASLAMGALVAALHVPLDHPINGVGASTWVIGLMMAVAVGLMIGYLVLEILRSELRPLVKYLLAVLIAPAIAALGSSLNPLYVTETPQPGTNATMVMMATATAYLLGSLVDRFGKRRGE